MATLFFSAQLAQIAPPTQGFVHSLTSDDHLLVRCSATTVTKQSRRPIATPTAKRRQSLDAVRKRQTGQKFSKRPAIGISVQPNQKQVLLHSVNHSFDKRHKAREKLGFIHQNHLVFVELLIREFIQRHHSNTGNLSAIVCDQGVIIAIAGIARMLHNKHASSQRRIARHDTQNTRGLSRKHGTDNHIQRHLLKYSAL